MRLSIEIDDQLMRDALRLSGLRTKKAVVDASLRLLAEMDPRDAKRFMQECERDKQSRPGKSRTSPRGD
jgi:Arc/MetJ family transcription regulator